MGNEEVDRLAEANAYIGPAYESADHGAFKSAWAWNKLDQVQFLLNVLIMNLYLLIPLWINTYLQTIVHY